LASASSSSHGSTSTTTTRSSSSSSSHGSSSSGSGSHDLLNEANRVRLQTEIDAEFARHLQFGSGIPLPRFRRRRSSRESTEPNFQFYYPDSMDDQMQTGQLEFHHLHNPTGNEAQFALAGEDDELYGDESIDLDNMSYEEILALEDRLGKVPHGAPIQAISLLPTSKYQKISHPKSSPLRSVTSPKPGECDKKEKEIKSTLSEEKSCCICLEDFQDGEDIRRLPCFHIFHQEEIDRWLSDNNSCPICKTPIT